MMLASHSKFKLLLLRKLFLGLKKLKKSEKSGHSHRKHIRIKVFYCIKYLIWKVSIGIRRSNHSVVFVMPSI